MTAPSNHRDIPISNNGDAAPPLAPASTSPAPRSGRGRSRIGGLWVTAVAFALVLLLLLIFILENGQRAEVAFFGAHGHLPMGVALLLAAVFGVLLVALPGTARIVQLRILSRRRRQPAPARLTAPVTVPADEQQPAP